MQSPSISPKHAPVPSAHPVHLPALPPPPLLQLPEFIYRQSIAVASIRPPPPSTADISLIFIGSGRRVPS
jgi:hypothetical protein